MEISKEEKEAIDNLKCLIGHLGNKYYKVTFTGEDLDFLQTILNLIQKQEERIKELEESEK